MEALAAALYRKWPRAYLLIAFAAAGLLIVLSLGMPTMLSVAVFVELDFRTTVVLFLRTLLVAAALAVIGGRLAWTGLRPLHAWATGDRRDPVAAWRAGRDMPRVVARRFVPTALLIVPASAVLVDRSGHLPAPELAAVVVGAVLIVATAAALAIVLLELVCRPVLTDVSVAAGDASLFEESGLSARARLILAVGLGAWCSSVLTAAAVELVEEPDARFLAAILIGVGTCAYLVLVLRALVFGPLLEPLSQLRAATLRIGEGDFTEPVPVTTGDELGALADSFNRMQRGLAERAALQDAFGTYVDPSLVQRLIASGVVGFEGEQVEVTVLFVDVRDFTTYAESVAPSVAVARLNRLFETVVPIVREECGHPNHFLGDGLLAVFGAPDRLTDHADRALAAARRMRVAVEEVFGGEVRVGIGLNTGPVIAGTIGGGGKLDYTVIGDVVNVAARVEELTKETGDTILLTGATASCVTDCSGLVDRGTHLLRGKVHPVSVLADPA